tara:strand:+ start:2136 stop:2387 length:252 start_codon:yes stop_codon:yes gene_type:complete
MISITEARDLSYRDPVGVLEDMVDGAILDACETGEQEMYFTLSLRYCDDMDVLEPLVEIYKKEGYRVRLTKGNTCINISWRKP